MLKRFFVGFAIASALLTSNAVAASNSPEEADAAYQRGDYVAAFRLFRALAEGGDAVAQFRVGGMYYNGQSEGAEIRPKELEWAQAGLGVPRYYPDAMRWFKLAAAQGYPPAQVQLSFMYSNGMGAAPDHGEAARWDRLAAARGYAPGQYALGADYYGGYGVSKDYAEAAHWFHLAAEQGHADSQEFLGYLYGTGVGVPQDQIQAYFWYALAASSLRREANQASTEYSRKQAAEHLANILEDVDFAGKLLTPDQLAEAQRLARKWKSKSPP